MTDVPVQKFRSFDEATRALSSALTPPLGFRGVSKYRSIEDANADRARMTLARPLG